MDLLIELAKTESYTTSACAKDVGSPRSQQWVTRLCPARPGRLDILIELDSQLLHGNTVTLFEIWCGDGYSSRRTSNFLTIQSSA
jgi:hypothetical protein